MKIEVKNAAPGGIVKYRNTTCIVLEHRPDGTLLLAAAQIKHRFGETNRYPGSALCDKLNGTYLTELTEGRPQEILPRVVDLTDIGGSKEYGACECQVAPLTLDEIRKYRALIPVTGYEEWTVTPWGTPGVNEQQVDMVIVRDDGDISCRRCENHFLYSHPAFLVRPGQMVEVEMDECGPLERYSTKELLAELARRVG